VVNLRFQKRSRLRIEDSLIDQPAQIDWLDTTPDERTMATLAHALQFIGSWIAPLIIFLSCLASAALADYSHYSGCLTDGAVVYLFGNGFCIPSRQS
jgi:hypothetical protein